MAPTTTHAVGLRTAPVASTAPENAPVTSRAPNCIGTRRLGVLGSWSVTNSPSARMVSTATVIGCATHSAHVPSRSIQPSAPAHATTAGAVSARKPATTPISRASSRTRKYVMRTSGPVEMSPGR